MCGTHGRSNALQEFLTFEVVRLGHGSFQSTKHKINQVLRKKSVFPVEGGIEKQIKPPLVEIWLLTSERSQSLLLLSLKCPP